MVENLSQLIEEKLPAGAVALLRLTADIATRRGESLYLVGGVVRDFLLGRDSFDLDVVVEGDAIALAAETAEATGGKLTKHTRFGTATVLLDEFVLDVVTARAETYTKPGALPSVKPGKLADDLKRRDFTINAMALRLTGPQYGELIDTYHGRQDLERKLVRVLHDDSFRDDATRMWRAIRYEQRLGFSIEEHTLKLLQRDLDYLGAVSGDRIRHEIELVFEEKEPERVLQRASELGILQKVHPALGAQDTFGDEFRRAREIRVSGHALLDLYWVLLTLGLRDSALEEVIKYLRPTRRLAAAMRDANQLAGRLPEISRKDVPASVIYAVLNGYAPAAIEAHLISGVGNVNANIRRYLSKLQFVKAQLTGRDMAVLGVPAGPRTREVVVLLHNARLDGEVSTRQDEERLVKEWLGRNA